VKPTIHERICLRHDRQKSGGHLRLALILFAMTVVFIALHAFQDGALELAREVAQKARELIRGEMALGAAGFLAACAFLINLPAPLAAVLKVASGFIFGQGIGAALNVCGSCAGAVLGFLVSRHFLWKGGETIRAIGGEGLKKRIDRDGFWFVLATRVSTVTPFFLVNILAGASGIRMRDFFWASALGVVPSSIFYAMAGEILGVVTSLSDLVTPKFAAAVAGLTLLALAPTVVGRRFRRDGHGEARPDSKR
jgi:uncharacterized membrane protein YdjX (TVP38/TMEM64 family)